MRRRHFLVLGLLVLDGCAATTSDVTLADDAAGGTDSRSPVDAGNGGEGGPQAPDAEGPDAAPVDGGGSTDGDTRADAGDDGADGPASCAGLFCEDFEQGQLDPTKWDIQTGGAGTESIQQQTVSHGQYAMHVHGTGASSDFALILTKNAPAALQGAGPVFGRTYLFDASTIDSVHTELAFAGTTGFPKLNYTEFAEYGSGSWQLGFDLFNPDPSVAPGFVEETAYPPNHDLIPLMTWSCIEWEFGDDPDAMLLWVDGTQVDQFDANHIDYSSTTRTPGSVLNGKDSGIVGGFAVFGFGFHAWHPSKAFDLYYDDIVLDTKRVGCLK